VSLSRIDDHLFPTSEFAMDMTLIVEESGVTSVSAVAGTEALTFEEDTPGSGEWELVEEPDYADLAALQAAVNGTWTVTVAGTTPSTSTFKLDAAALVQGDFLAVPTNMSPAHGTTGVSSTATLSWSDNTGVTVPYALAVEYDGDAGFDEALSVLDLGILDIPITATSWQPSNPMPVGPIEYGVFYADVDLPVLATTISALQVTSGSITWGAAGFAPAGYPAATPFLVLGAESIVVFTVPEPTAAPLTASVLVMLSVLARRRRAAGRLS
jgi:hypothetical protein